METSPTGSGPVSPAITVSEEDILFECPRCGKSMVVDQKAAGLIVDCPQCHIDVVVPSKPPTIGDVMPNLAAVASQLAADDVLFECPECGKSMVINDSAVGAYVECPRCRVYVVVPPSGSETADLDDEQRNGAATLNNQPPPSA
jgi:DNA-directed RNA polymerase subunit RPC12/RpoP